MSATGYVVGERGTVSDETITLAAVASRLALTSGQTERARVLLGGRDEAAVKLVLRCCRQAQRESEQTGAHAYNAELIGMLVRTEQAA
jgi:hypothetical protein